VPRAWFEAEQPFGVERLWTTAGRVSLTFHLGPHLARIEAEMDVELRHPPRQLLLRFRHPRKRTIRAVYVDGCPHSAFDAAKEDVELAPRSGKIRVVACFD